jgi:phage baseplate assembly protein W
MSADFVGRGWAFPLRTDATGAIALVSERHELEESMRLILATAHGDRPMRPEFGCGIHRFVFAPPDETTAAQIAAEVRAALVRWETRIELLGVEVTVADAATLHIDVRYSVGDGNDERNLVFPFYTIPGEGAELED